MQFRSLSLKDDMARICELTGVKTHFGNSVSHSEIKTRSRWLPNLQNASIFSDSLKKSFRFRVTPNALRTVDKVGGLDLYLLSANNKLLSRSAIAVKNVVLSVMNKSSS